MRIVAGRFRGTALTGPGKGAAEALRLRPTPDRVREALFSMLFAGHDAPQKGSTVLDLFAGTGAMGFEALSRGAARTIFVEKGREALGLIRRNAEKLRLGEDAEIVARDALRLGPRTGPAASLVFLDPPYGKDLGAKALQAALAGGWIAEGALVSWEEDAAMDAPPGWELLDTRSWGTTHVTILRAPGGA
ncbi:RsmD family RNA methyltransferase [Roseicyclus sp. F158]|uniref:RsmD family RNA methyltransferase n=1 Tax=Tropicimonas omnivorans TaxID=3075590 RepID=A0ABU3DCD2_9RHOB|nr:RsmD family RNA methyltransferase [Roseicyclus sp. F158]MDT0681367.1 RsmD family RNA methyltransferase [Roseicyclus sp. F158]